MTILPLTIYTEQDQVGGTRIIPRAYGIWCALSPTDQCTPIVLSIVVKRVGLKVPYGGFHLVTCQHNLKSTIDNFSKKLKQTHEDHDKPFESLEFIKILYREGAFFIFLSNRRVDIKAKGKSPIPLFTTRCEKHGRVKA